MVFGRAAMFYNRIEGADYAEGAAIGALGGAVLGGALGNHQDKQQQNPPNQQYIQP